MVKADLRDLIQVFVYNNLDIITMPNPLVRLPPVTRGALEAYINYLPGGFDLPPDLQQVLNTFILTNINAISVQRTPFGTIVNASLGDNRTLPP